MRSVTRRAARRTSAAGTGRTPSDVGARLTLATLAGRALRLPVMLVDVARPSIGTDVVCGVETFAAWSLVRLLGSIPSPRVGWAWSSSA